MADRLTTIAFAWTIARRDGVTIALTDHDQDISAGDRLYRAAPGMTPSAIRRGEGLDADTMEASGVLGDAAITADDLIAGRWDGARVTIAALDWRTGATVAMLGGGTIGAVETRDGGFTAELRGPAAALDRPAAEETTPTCRATLGDRRCRVPMADRRRHARVLASDGAAVTLDAAEPVANGWGGGLLRWLGGANCGLAAAVARSEGAVATLRAPPAFPVAPGTLVEIAEGCDRTIATCTARFANAANFRGEPYLPGIDLLTRYPGA